MHAGSQHSLPSIDILGTTVHLIDNDEVLRQIEAIIADRPVPCAYTIHSGFHGLYVASRVPDFQQIAAEAALFCPDGIAPVWIARLLGRHDGVRAPGPDLLRKFLTRAGEHGYSSYFLGGTEETLRALQKRLDTTYPHHRSVGMYSPPFRAHSEQEVEKMIQRINDAEPDVLWIGLGLPKQEHWIYEHRHKLNVPVACCVGAAFAFEAGTVKRAPAWIGNAGFEWAWRLCSEPRRLWRRCLIEGPSFVWTIARNWKTIRAANTAPPSTKAIERGK